MQRIAFYPTFEQLGPHLYVMKKPLVLIPFGLNASTLNSLSDLCVFPMYVINTSIAAPLVPFASSIFAVVYKC